MLGCMEKGWLPPNNAAPPMHLLPADALQWPPLRPSAMPAPSVLLRQPPTAVGSSCAAVDNPRAVCRVPSFSAWAGLPPPEERPRPLVPLQLPSTMSLAVSHATSPAMEQLADTDSSSNSSLSNGCYPPPPPLPQQLPLPLPSPLLLALSLPPRAALPPGMKVWGSGGGSGGGRGSGIAGGALAQMAPPVSRHSRAMISMIADEL